MDCCLFANIYFLTGFWETWFGVWLREVSGFDSLHSPPVDLHKHGLIVCQYLFSGCTLQNLIWSLIKRSFMFWEFALPTNGPSQAWTDCLPISILRLHSAKLDLEFDWEVSSFDSLHSLPGNLHKNGLFVCQCLKIWFGVDWDKFQGLTVCTSYQWTFTSMGCLFASVNFPIGFWETSFGVWLREVSSFTGLHSLSVDLHKHGLFVC